MSRVAIEGNASGSGTFTIAAPNSNNNRTISIPDGTGTMVVNGASSSIVADTAKSATSTAVDFTGIPSWIKRITVIFSGVSLSATADLLVQIGDSGGIETTGYVSGSGSGSNSTSGYVVRMGNAARAAYGVMQITNITGNNWVSFHSFNVGTTSDFAGGGGKTLSDVLTQLRITSTSTDTFDAGTINIIYE